METWATVVIVIVSNVIIAAVSILTTRMQVKHSANEFEKKLQADRDISQHERSWEVRSEPLVKLREELACMAEKFESMISLGTQVIGGLSLESDQIVKEHEETVVEFFRKAMKGWEEYYYSGRFEQALHMQYESSLKVEAKMIYLDYSSTYIGLLPLLSDKKAKSEETNEKILKAGDLIVKNSVRILEVQSAINELLEQL